MARANKPGKRLSHALRDHWPEYLMEAAGLGIFMISAGFFATIIEHPDLPIQQAIETPILRRIPMGLAMGLTAIGIIYSPWGQRSGAHINPAVTLAFYRLGKVKSWDALFYIVAQFIGGALGIMFVSFVLGSLIAHSSVRFVATLPGMNGKSLAFLAELIISFGLMSAVLMATNIKKLARWTGVFAGSLVATYIIFEAPLSGMSINPARTFASALPAQLWTGFWIYLTAPPLGMLLAAEIYVRTKGIKKVFCAKLHHENNKRCIFNCSYDEMSTQERNSSRN